MLEPKSRAGCQNSCPPMTTILPPPSCDGLSKPQQDSALPLLLRRARQRAVRGDHAAAGVLSDAHGGCDSRSARRRDGRRRAGRRRAGRVRLGLQPARPRFCCGSCRGSAPTSRSTCRRARSRMQRARLAARFPTLDVRPIVGDFSYPVALPADLAGRHKTGFFPGSTIGNLTPVEAAAPAAGIPARAVAGRPPDRRRRPQEGRAQARAGLQRRRRRHRRVQPQPAGAHQPRTRRHLRSRRLPARGHLQPARGPHRDAPRKPAGSGGARSPAAASASGPARRIHTENSYKYSIGQFQDLARAADWQPRRVWTDEDNLFSVHELISR